MYNLHAFFTIYLLILIYLNAIHDNIYIGIVLSSGTLCTARCCCYPGTNVCKKNVRVWTNLILLYFQRLEQILFFGQFRWKIVPVPTVDLCVHSRLVSPSAAWSPRGSASQHPAASLLGHQRAAGITLKTQMTCNSKNRQVEVQMGKTFERGGKVQLANKIM
jgi:hypothetical protein